MGTETSLLGGFVRPKGVLSMPESNSSNVNTGRKASNGLKQLVPIIERHIDELKKPGVISIRPGYRLENDLIQARRQRSDSRAL